MVQLLIEERYSDCTSSEERFQVPEIASIALLSTSSLLHARRGAEDISD
jgi:hypothetical protein